MKTTDAGTQRSNRIAAYGIFGTFGAGFILAILEPSMSPDLVESLNSLIGLVGMIFMISAGILLLRK